MRCDVLAVGTELLLGQIVDTNSSWLGENLAMHGFDSLSQVKVGDNIGRITGHLRRMLSESDAVIMCGGLGPTHDDLTREAIAEVMGVELHLDEDVADVIRHLFSSRNRTMPENNLRQAMVPEGATIIPQTRGTAPGLICPVVIETESGPAERVVYAVPGVPHEMREMFERAILPDLQQRSGEHWTIASRTLRTWGYCACACVQDPAHTVDPRLGKVRGHCPTRGSHTGGPNRGGEQAVALWGGW